MMIWKVMAGTIFTLASLTATSGAAERPRVVKETMTIESHMLIRDKLTKRVESRPQTVQVMVYRPNDGAKHPAIVYLHGGGMSFADPVMDRFHIELAGRGLVVLAPHYLLNRTGWQQWSETAGNTVTLATKLPSVDPEQIGMAGISMGGQIGLSTAARDPRIKRVAEFFTAWPGSLPDEPIDKLPPVLLLNGTADPVIPFEKAMVLDSILEHHKLPFERHVYQGLGHGFSTPASFKDGLARTSAFFGGRVDVREPSAGPIQAAASNAPARAASVTSDGSDDDGAGDDDEWTDWPTTPSFVVLAPSKKPKRLGVKKAATRESTPIPGQPVQP